MGAFWVQFCQFLKQFSVLNPFPTLCRVRVVPESCWCVPSGSLTTFLGVAKFWDPFIPLSHGLKTRNTRVHLESNSANFGSNWASWTRALWVASPAQPHHTTPRQHPKIAHESCPPPVETHTFQQWGSSSDVKLCAVRAPQKGRCTLTTVSPALQTRPNQRSTCSPFGCERRIRCRSGLVLEICEMPLA